MLIPTPYGTLDTDYPEDNITGTLSLLPQDLRSSIGSILERFTSMDRALEDAYEEGKANAQEFAENVRDKVHDLLDSLIDNNDFDKDTLSAIKYIRSVLDSI